MGERVKSSDLFHGTISRSTHHPHLPASAPVAGFAGVMSDVPAMCSTMRVKQADEAANLIPRQDDGHGLSPLVSASPGWGAGSLTQCPSCHHLLAMVINAAFLCFHCTFIFPHKGKPKRPPFHAVWKCFATSCMETKKLAKILTLTRDRKQ